MKKTSVFIDEVRLKYKPVSDRGVILYFILNNLNRINPIYQFSLKSFVVVFLHAMRLAENEVSSEQRSISIILNRLFLRSTVFFLVRKSFAGEFAKTTVDTPGEHYVSDIHLCESRTLRTG